MSNGFGQPPGGGGFGQPPGSAPGGGFGQPPGSAPGGGFGQPPSGGGAPGFGAPGGGAPDTAQGLAIGSLICGIISWVMCTTLVTAIPGAIMGKIALNKIESGESNDSSKMLATIGFWASVVNIVLTVLGTCLYIIFIIVMVGASNA